jgi:hypothetical protein
MRGDGMTSGCYLDKGGCHEEEEGSESGMTGCEALEAPAGIGGGCVAFETGNTKAMAPNGWRTACRPTDDECRFSSRVGGWVLRLPVIDTLIG